MCTPKFHGIHIRKLLFLHRESFHVIGFSWINRVSADIEVIFVVSFKNTDEWQLSGSSLAVLIFQNFIFSATKRVCAGFFVCLNAQLCSYLTWVCYKTYVRWCFNSKRMLKRLIQFGVGKYLYKKKLSIFPWLLN